MFSLIPGSGLGASSSRLIAFGLGASVIVHVVLRKVIRLTTLITKRWESGSKLGM